MTNENDTDPSSPGARRGLAASDTEPTPSAARRVSTTQKGLAPPLPAPSAPPPSPTAVRASSPPGQKKDSVELLLDAMQGPALERPRIAPQTDGQSSAAYHTQHEVRPAHTEPDEQPSVVVERVPMSPTLKIDRTQLATAIEAAKAARLADKMASEPPPVTLGPRVVIAMVAGLAVVLVLFLVARTSLQRKNAAPALSPPDPLVTATTAPAAPLPSATPVAPSAVAAASASSAWVPVASAASSSPPAAPTTPSRTRPRGTPPAGTGDMGEFKTTFH
jgi:hypothetical protein